MLPLVKIFLNKFDLIVKLRLTILFTGAVEFMSVYSLVLQILKMKYALKSLKIKVTLEINLFRV